MKIVLRPQSTDSEWKFIFRLEKTAEKSGLYQSFPTFEECRDYLSKGKVFIIHYDNHPVGYCSYGTIDNGNSEVNGLIVKPEYRGKGIAGEALKLMFKKAKEVKRFHLVTHPKNIAAVKVYLNLGFVINGYSNNYKGWGPRVKLARKNRSFN